MKRTGLVAIDAYVDDLRSVSVCRIIEFVSRLTKKQVERLDPVNPC